MRHLKFLLPPKTLKDPDQRANYDRMVADGRGQINVTSFKNIHQQKFTLEKDGPWKYWVHQRFWNDICIEIVSERVLSPHTWPWAKPENLLNPLMFLTLLFQRTFHLNMASAFYLSVCTIVPFFVLVWYLMYYYYVNLAVYGALLVLLTPHFFFLKNRLQAYWLQVLIVCVALYLVWFVFLGPFVYSLVIVAIFVEAFQLQYYAQRRKWLTVLGLIGLYFICDTYVVQWARMLMFVASAGKLFVLAKNYKKQPHSHNPTPGNHSSHGHSHFPNQHNHSHNHNHSHSHQPHTHSHSQHTHSHSHQSHGHSHAPNQPQVYDLPNGCQIKFTPDGKVFLRKPGTAEFQDITEQWQEQERLHEQQAGQ